MSTSKLFPTCEAMVPGSASVDFSSIDRLYEKVNDLVDDSLGARDIRSALACIVELEEHGRALRHSRDYWAGREAELRRAIVEYVAASMVNVPADRVQNAWEALRNIAKGRDEVVGPCALFGVWVATADNPHPDKPGKKSYEIVPCLVVHKGEIEICAWNCEHGVWDDAEGDDFRYQTAQVSHWMPLPSLPSPDTQVSRGAQPTPDSQHL